jgi:hypothetical protein
VRTAVEKKTNGQREEIWIGLGGRHENVQKTDDLVEQPFSTVVNDAETMQIDAFDEIYM